MSSTRDGMQMTEARSSAESDYLTTPGTWLAEVSPDRTRNLADRLNLMVAGLESVKNQILIGVDSEGNQPRPGSPRADVVEGTAFQALEDLVLLRRLVAETIHAVAAAAISGGGDRTSVLAWAHYESDGQALTDGVNRLLGEDIDTGGEPGRSESNEVPGYHLERARGAADAVAAYGVDGSPELLLADAVRHLAAAVAALQVNSSPAVANRVRRP